MSNGFSNVGGASRPWKVLVTHVASEHKWVKLYVQRDLDSVSRIEDYIEQCEESLRKQSGYSHQDQLPLGTPCLALFSDDKWYRAAVSAWPKSDATFVEVTFIDYGNPEIVSVASIRAVDEDLFETPPLAMECFLDGIDVNLIPPKDASELIEHLKGLLLYEEVTLHVLRYEQVSSDCIRPIVSVVLAEGGQLVEQLKFTFPSVPTSTFKYLALPLDSTHDVYVSHVDNMDNVYLHLCGKDPSDLTNKVRSYCESNFLPPVSTVHEGMACLSQFSEDGILYRSLVSSVAGPMCKVLFVDYGNSEKKPVKDLLTIPACFLENPVYAHHCKVCNLSIDPVTFRDVTADVPLKCRFVSRCGPTKYNVELSGLSDLETPVENGLLPQPMSMQRLSLDPNTTCAMYISFIESVELMYGQLKETAEDIEGISTRLATECETMFNNPMDAQPGAAVACVYEGQWYRAEVIDVGQKVTVWIADYGDTVQLDKSDLRPLDQRYLLQPAYALKLTLEGYKCDPRNVGEATAVLQDLVLDVEVRVHIVSSSPDGTHVVRLFVGDPPVSVTRKLPSPLNSVKVPPPILSTVERITVLSVFPPGTFFGQLSKYSVEDLNSLQDSLLKHYSNVAPEAGFVPVVDQHVCCRFSEDDGFYRAKVVNVESGGRYKVFYLDYGNEEVLVAENIFPLAAVFTQMPQFGILCSLEGNPVDDLVSQLIETEVEVRLVRKDESVHWVVLSGASSGSVSAPPAAVHAPPAVPQPVASDVRVAQKPLSMLPAELVVGQTASVEVVFAVSPAEFYCQTKATENELNALMDAIAALEAEPPLHEALLKVGLPCVALYSEDGGWYRARVVELRPDGVLVFFVDYGNTEVVQCSSLRALPPQHTQLSEQALMCKLAGIQPSGWSSEATAKFEELVTGQVTTIGVISKSGPCHEVDLTLADGRAVAGVLSQEGFLTPLQPLKSSPMHGSSPDVGFHYHSLVPGTCVQATVSWVLTPGEVFIQDTSTADALDMLMAKLQSHYAQSCPEVDPVRAGQACVAKFSEDSMWYRARVTHSKGGKLGVHYVDYGNCEEVSVSDVRKIIPAFVELPTQAVRCQIRGLRPPGPSWTAVAPGGPLDNILSGVLVCRPFASQDGLHLVDFERALDGTSVADLLVSAGLAKAAKENGGSNSEVSSASKPRMCIPPVEVSFQAGQYVDVKVTAALSLGEIWCRSLQALDTIADALMEAAKSAKKVANPVAGDGCVAYALDSQWSRAVVRSRPSPAKIEVVFVDIGIVQTLHHAKVKPISQELTELPAQAFQCCLEAGGRDVSVESLQTLVDRELVLEVKGVKDGCVLGSLFDTTGEDEVNVLDALAAKVCLPANGAAPVRSEEETSAVQEPVDIVPERTHRPSFSRNHVIVPCYAPVSKLSGKMAAYVMHVDDLNCFYVMRKDQEPQLENLGTLIQQRYAGGNGDPVNPVPKMPCIAMSPADSQWYRAKIVDFLDDVQAVVHFIDYGNTEETTQFRAVPAEFLEIPPFCYKCKLDGSKNLANVPGAVEKFTELVSDVEVELEVVTWGHEVAVRLSREGVDVALQLTGDANDVANPAQDPSIEGQEVVVDDAQAFATKPVEGEVCCIISHVDALDQFYVYPAEREDELAEFCSRVQEVLEAENSVIENPRVGLACCTRFSEDEQWYRAIVLEAGSKLKVRFVDYGNSESVDSVARIPEELLCVPTFCFCCKLDGKIKGNDGVSKLKDLVASAEHVMVKVVQWGEPATVILCTSDNSDIGAQLSAETADDQVEELILCSDKYMQLEVPLHSKSCIEVSHVNSPLDFYVTFAEQKETLDEVAAILEEAPSHMEGFEPKVGCCCTAVYTDGLTYRATVLCNFETEVTVLFVDYGNVETIETKDVFCLPASLATIPVLAVHCRLDADANLVSTEEASEKFKELVEGKTSLLAEFLRQEGDVFVVRLLDMGIDILPRITEASVEVAGSVDLLPDEILPDSVATANAVPEQAEDPVFGEPDEEPETLEPSRTETDGALTVDATSGKDANGNLVDEVEPAVDSSSGIMSTKTIVPDSSLGEEVHNELQNEAESLQTGFEAGDKAATTATTEPKDMEHYMLDVQGGTFDEEHVSPSTQSEDEVETAPESTDSGSVAPPATDVQNYSGKELVADLRADKIQDNNWQTATGANAEAVEPDLVSEAYLQEDLTPEGSDPQDKMPSGNRETTKTGDTEHSKIPDMSDARDETQGNDRQSAVDAEAVDAEAVDAEHLLQVCSQESVEPQEEPNNTISSALDDIGELAEAAKSAEGAAQQEPEPKDREVIFSAPAEPEESPVPAAMDEFTSKNVEPKGSDGDVTSNSLVDTVVPLVLPDTAEEVAAEDTAAST